MNSKNLISVPVRIISEANNSDHWNKKRKRKIALKNTIRLHLNSHHKPKLPCKIILTRISPRSLDIDNLWSALKGPIDAISDWLFPGQAPGQADNDRRIEFAVGQRKGKPRQYALEIEFHSPEALYKEIKVSPVRGAMRKG